LKYECSYRRARRRQRRRRRRRRRRFNVGRVLVINKPTEEKDAEEIQCRSNVFSQQPPALAAMGSSGNRDIFFPTALSFPSFPRAPNEKSNSSERMSASLGGVSINGKSSTLSTPIASLEGHCEQALD
jgi:hypothetical protein